MLFVSLNFEVCTLKTLLIFLLPHLPHKYVYITHTYICIFKHSKKVPSQYKSNLQDHLFFFFFKYKVDISLIHFLSLVYQCSAHTNLLYSIFFQVYLYDKFGL